VEFLATRWSRVRDAGRVHSFDPAIESGRIIRFSFLIFSTALMLMTARSRRFAEYWPPFAILFAAFTLQP